LENNLNIDQLNKLIKTFCEDRDWGQYHNAKDLSIGIVTEASELLQLFRFKSNLEVDNMLTEETIRTEIGEELADILFFILRFAQKYNFDLSYELNRKVEINKKRYPISEYKGSNKKNTNDK